MLYDIKPSDQIERSVRERQLLGGALLNLGQATGPAKIEGFSRNVDALSGAKLCQHLEIGTGATTNVENPRSRLFHLAANPADEFRDDATPAGEPPVLPLDLVHDRIGVLLHLARQRIVKLVYFYGQNFQSLNPSGAASPESNRWRASRRRP